MDKLTRIFLLEEQIKQEINRVEQGRLIDWEKEESKFKVYEKLTREILENYV